MSSIRLFILSSFAELGPMHGHRLRLEAEQRHVHLWTDITVGAVYGAMKRLAAEGLLRAAGSEQEGNRPTRQIFAITDEGRAALETLRRAGLNEVWFKYDPFDLALTELDAASRDSLSAILDGRMQQVKQLLADSEATFREAFDYIGVAKQWALRHTLYRLKAEIAYLEDLAATADAIVADERDPAARKPKRG